MSAHSGVCGLDHAAWTAVMAFIEGDLTQHAAALNALVSAAPRQWILDDEPLDTTTTAGEGHPHLRLITPPN